MRGAFMTNRFIPYTFSAVLLILAHSVVQSADVLPPSTRSIGDSTRGEELYNASCIVCHGSRAEGGIGPKLAGNAVLLNDQAFWKVVHEGRHVMPPQKGLVTDQQLNDIRAWLKTLP